MHIPKKLKNGKPLKEYADKIIINKQSKPIKIIINLSFCLDLIEIYFKVSLFSWK